MISLSDIAAIISKLFQACIRTPSHVQSESLLDESWKPDHDSLKESESRFKIWCGNLGVRQWGHASLDWRLREAPQIRKQITDLLQHVKDDLENCFEMLSGQRALLNTDSDDSDGDGVQSKFTGNELDVRIASVANAVQNLYRISYLIRNQKTRRRNVTKTRNDNNRDPESGLDLFEDGYGPFDRSHIRQMLGNVRDVNENVTIENKVGELELQHEDLVERLAAANVSRRKQFSHWERHARKLQQEAPAQPTETSLNQRRGILERPVSVSLADREKTSKRSALSPTEITATHREAVKPINPDTEIDTQSMASFASTIRDIEGHEAALPDPPQKGMDGHAFECPYCFVLCSPKEAGKRKWRHVTTKHMLEDLQPYLCVYPQCSDKHRLYGSRLEWMAHEESLHRKVWKCREHPNKPYRNESDFRSHLEIMHASMDTESIDAMIEFACTSIEDDRTQCPLCLRTTAELLPGQTLFKHIANHLEKLATFAIPRNVNLSDDTAKSGSNVPAQADDNERSPRSSEVLSEWSDSHQQVDQGGVELSSERLQEIGDGTANNLDAYINDLRLRQQNEDVETTLDFTDSTRDNASQSNKRAADVVLSQELPLNVDLVAIAMVIQKRWRQVLRRREIRVLSATSGQRNIQEHTPEFLKQSKAALHAKFVDLEWEQRNRLLSGTQEASSNLEDPIDSAQLYRRLPPETVSARNRYLNVEPYALNRIKLKGPEGFNDYINASPILVGEHRYIATQGPKDNTINHFWRMIADLEHSTPSTVIIMLTQTYEAGREKCSTYYPETTDTHMDILPDDEDPYGFQGKVVLDELREVDWARCQLRAMTLESQWSHDGPSRRRGILHLTFAGWPDFLIPEGEDRTALLGLIQLSRKLTYISAADDLPELPPLVRGKPLIVPNPSSTRIVHCSAGIGRTGTFIALDDLLSHLHNGDFDILDPPDRDPVSETVDLLRQQRMMMVQGESQFGFVYEILREDWNLRADLGMTGW